MVVESRRTSGRIKRERESEKPPEPQKSAERPKKIRKIHARGKPSDLPPASKRDATGTPRRADSSSNHASPAPLAKLSRGSPLPTAPTDTYFDDQNSQTVAKSGVLAASVARSRSQWVSGAIFDRYWTKPRKSKGQSIEPPNNPAKETMTSPLGKVRVTIEPHTIDAVIYGIRDVPASSMPTSIGKPVNSVGVPPPVPPNPAYPIEQPRPYQASPMSSTQPFNAQRPAPYASPATLNAPQSMSPYPAQPPSQLNASTTQSTNIPSPAPPAPSQPSPAPNGQLPSALNGQQPPAPTVQAPTTTSTPQRNPPAQPQQQATPRTTPQPRAAPPQQPQRPQQQVNQDPVIQALARRAQENTDLKGLMKIVAAGQATPDQLAEFQKHIDELTQQVRQQQAVQNATNPPKPAPGPAPPGPQNLQQYPQASTQPPQGPVRATMGPGASYQYLQKPAPRPPQQPDKFPNLAIEFLNPTAACNSTPNDRLLFPKYAVVMRSADYSKLHVSFLVVKTVAGRKVHENVSMVVEPLEGRSGVLGVIERSVATLEEARKHMDETIRTTKRAPKVELVLRTLGSDKENKSTAANANSVRASPAAGESRRGKKREEDLSGLCALCFGLAGENSEVLEDGGVSCKGCRVLRAKNEAKGVGRAVKVEVGRREVRSGECLVW